MKTHVLKMTILSPNGEKVERNFTSRGLDTPGNASIIRDWMIFDLFSDLADEGFILGRPCFAGS